MLFKFIKFSLICILITRFTKIHKINNLNQLYQYHLINQILALNGIIIWHYRWQNNWKIVMSTIWVLWGVGLVKDWNPPRLWHSKNLSQRLSIVLVNWLVMREIELLILKLTKNWKIVMSTIWALWDVRALLVKDWNPPRLCCLSGKKPDIPTIKDNILFWKTYCHYIKQEIQRMRISSTNSFKTLFIKGT